MGTPDAGAFGRVIAEHGVSNMFTAPTAIRAIKKEDPQGKMLRQYDLSKLRAYSLPGALRPRHHLMGRKIFANNGG